MVWQLVTLVGPGQGAIYLRNKRKFPVRKTIRTLPYVLGISISLSAAGAVEPQAVDLGTFDFIPTLSLSQSYDDNIFRQPDDDEESSGITRVSPTLQFVAQDRNNTYAFTYDGDYGVYSNDSDDNYDDHTLSADFHLDLNSMNTVDLGAAYGKLHDNRGEGASEGVVAESRDEPDEYDIAGVNGTWAIGRPGAMFGVELDAGYTDIEYTNNRRETRFRDRDDQSFAARLFGRVSPKTRLFVEASTKDISYDNRPLAGARLDNDEQALSVGAEWEATARTTGRVKVGRTDKEFDAASRGDTEFTSWEAEVSWMPRTYSEFVLSWSNQPRETNGTGNFIESEDLQLVWTHGWSDRLTTNLTMGLGDDEFDNNPREDEREFLSAGVEYDFRRWVSVNAAYSYKERDSNIRVFQWDQNVFTVGVDLSL